MTSRVHVARICVALIVLCLAAYSGVFTNGFVAGDDSGYVRENPHVLAGLTGSSVRWAFQATEQCNWHPVTWLSHILDVQVFGLDPSGHHGVSLLFHIANTLLLFLLLARMTGDIRPSVLVAALFAVHPLHVESVAWIAERKDVLSTFFWMLTLGAWLRFLDSKTPARYVWVIASYALGLMAKPMLVTLPFTLLLLDFWPLARLKLPVRSVLATLPRLLLEKAPLFAMALASSVITVVVQRRGGATQTLENLGIQERVANALVAYVGYLRHAVWPTSLSAFYPRPAGGIAGWQVAGAAIVLGAITTFALRMAGRAPYILFGWLWYLGTLVPVIGLLQVGDQAMADRYTYVPLIGIFVGCAWIIARPALVPVGVAIVVVLTLLTRVQVGYWSNGIALFGHALALDPGNFVAHNNLGFVLAAAGRQDEALVHYETAVQLNPAYSEAQNNLGAILAEKGRSADAIEHYEAALRLQPARAKTLNNLGLALASVDRLPEAIQRWQEALTVQPNFADARSNLGVALARSGRLSEAVEQFEAALRDDPGHASARANLEKIRAAIAAQESGGTRHP